MSKQPGCRVSKQPPCYLRVTQCQHSAHDASEAFFVFLSPFFVDEVSDVRDDDELAEEQRRQRGVGLGLGVDSGERPKIASR